MKRILLLNCLFLLAGSIQSVHAQNNTSPYSIIGIGDIEKSSFDRSSGMGHAGLALSSKQFFYQANPAAFSSIDEHFFYFETNARYKSVNYTGTPISDPTQSNSTDLQIKKIVLAIKPLPKWALSFGLMPYSTANYSFNAQKNVQGSNIAADAYYQGSGSTNQAFLTNSFNISKNFSVGLQASYLFGQLKETETLSDGVTDSVLNTTRNIYLGAPYFKLGAQYKAKINKNWGLGLGATITNKADFTADYNLLVQNGNSILINKEYQRANYFSVPVTYAGGFALNYKNAYTFAADYTYQGWGSLNYKGINYSLVNSQRISAGVEYSKKVSYLDQQYERYFLQAGFYYNDSYLRIAGNQLTDYGATIGAGIQLTSTLGLQGAIEIGKTGTTDNGLIKENYSQFNLTISYRDFWIPRKMKKYN